MFSILESVWHAVLSVPYLVITFFVLAINGAIISLGALLGVALSLLPSFPSAPKPASGVLGGLLWFLPLGSIMAVFTLLVSAWVTFLGVKVALKWGRAL